VRAVLSLHCSCAMCAMSAQIPHVQEAPGCCFESLRSEGYCIRRMQGRARQSGQGRRGGEKGKAGPEAA